MKIYTWLQKVILAVMTCIFLIIAGGNLFQFSQISLSDGSNTPFLFILGMIVCAQLFIDCFMFCYNDDCIFNIHYFHASEADYR